MADKAPASGNAQRLEYRRAAAEEEADWVSRST
jgi:hypothetical protein